jgi:cytochrome c oxidase subunit II
VRLLDGIQSALNPQGPDAAVLAEMAWVLAGGAALIFIAVIALAAYAAFADRSRASRLSPRALIVVGGIVFPAFTLTAVLAYSLWRMSSLADAAEAPAVRIEVIGEQWWWRVRYPEFETANEIRIPVGRPVELVLRSADVIHSFWLPALHGKLDMVPGRTNRLRLRAERTGEFRGQCAEYCGGPHAFMAFFAVALTPEDYEQWVEQQRRPSEKTPPALFLSHCSSCHTVRGTPAAGALGPDLTHVGSRRTLGAGLLPNNPGAAAGWIASSQHLKPGNLMPSFPMFTGEELRALAAYLESLQ